MSPEQFATLRDAIRQGPEGVIPYAHAAAVIGPLVAAVVALFFLLKAANERVVAEKQGRLDDAKERLDEQKQVAVTLDRATQALMESRRAA